MSKSATESKVWPLVMAAGMGSRFGASIPKQYVRLQGQTVIEHTVSRLAKSPFIKSLVMVVAKNDTQAKTLDYPMDVIFCTGGHSRAQSVLCGLKKLIHLGAKGSDRVLIHDAARPLIHAEDVDRVINKALQHPYGAILATPVRDTLKRACQDRLSIEHTLDRSCVWMSQTPQVYRIGELINLMQADTDLNLTDEAQYFEQAGLPIAIVPACHANFKLTHPDDAFVISQLLKPT